MSVSIPTLNEDGFLRGNRLIFIDGVITLVIDNSPDYLDYLTKMSSFIVKGKEPGFNTTDGNESNNSIIEKEKD